MSDQDRSANTEFIDIQAIANEIRSRIEQRFPTVDTIQDADAGDTEHNRLGLQRHSISLTAIAAPLKIPMASVTGLLEHDALIGQLPPTPPTIRGRIGGFLVSGVRRALFWYTPQINRFQEAVGNAFREQMSALSDLAARTNAIQMIIRSMSRQLGVVDRVPELERTVSDIARRTQDGVSSAQIAEMERRLQMQLTEREDGVTEAISSIRSQLLTATEALNEQLRTEISRREQAEAHLKTLTETLNRMRVETREALSLKPKVLIQNNRIEALVQQMRRDASEPKLPTNVLTEATGSLPAQMYVDFEYAFRGGREDIKRRVSAYIPRLQALGIGGLSMPVVDVGCGRGEWLDVLSGHGMHAVGIDSNSAMVEESKQRGLPVQVGDAVEYLRDLPAESQGAITGLHIVEHMPTDRLIQLFDEAVRVLKPGGIVIFETPNPENLFVSSLSFYLDPTHRAPIPPALLQFIAESRGLCAAEILYLHPYPESYTILSNTEPGIAKFLNQHFYGPQDYALVATKT
jgi:O-antigen chain-terminating methyltransferase